jgi:hypothetical protein
MLKMEMERFTRELSNAEQELAAASKTLIDPDDTLERALTVAGNCEREYVVAPPRIRRQINQGLFRKLFIGRDGSVEGSEPFGQLLTSERVSVLSGQVVHGRAEEVWETVQTVTEMSPNVPAQRTMADVTDGRDRPSSVFTNTFGQVGETKQPDDDAVRLGLHNERSVPLPDR